MALTILENVIVYLCVAPVEKMMKTKRTRRKKKKTNKRPIEIIFHTLLLDILFIHDHDGQSHHKCNVNIFSISHFFSHTNQTKKKKKMYTTKTNMD